MKSIYLNEDLLRGIEADNVEDSDVYEAYDETQICLCYKSKCFSTDFMENYISKLLNKLYGFDEPNIEVERRNGILADVVYVKFCLNKHMQLSYFCDALCQLIVPRNAGVEIMIGYDRDSCFGCCLHNSSHSDYMMLTISHFDRFVDFFRNYFPDVTEKESFNCFVRSFVKHQNDESDFCLIRIRDDKASTIINEVGETFIVDKKGNFVSDLWFNEIHGFKDGFALVEKDNLENFIDMNGKLLSDKWFLKCLDFNEGFAPVRCCSGEYNFIDESGEFLIKNNKLFDSCSNFKYGFACVMSHDRYNFVDMKGNLLSDIWYNDVSNETKDGFVRVKKKNKWNFVDNRGNVLSKDLWFSQCLEFEDGFAEVKLNNKWNFIDNTGTIISKDRWFSEVKHFSEGLAPVKINKKWNFIDTSGNIVFDEWHDNCSYFREGFAVVCRYNRRNQQTERNFINKQGELVSPHLWFEGATHFKNGFAVVSRRGDMKKNLIDTTGKVISDKWFDYVYDFKDGFSLVQDSELINYINTKGELMFNEWLKTPLYFKPKDEMLVSVDGTIRISPDHNFIATV